MPLVPGVMLLEWAVREAARALSIDTRDLRIRESKFVAALRPGEQAELFLTSASPRHAFKVYRAAELLASGTLEQK